MTPVISHALEGLVVELFRLDQLLKALECLDSRRTKAVLKNAREKFRSVADNIRAHLHSEAPEGSHSVAVSSTTSSAGVPDAKRQRTLDPVVFTRTEPPSAHGQPVSKPKCESEQEKKVGHVLPGQKEKRVAP